jgi:UDP-N-acetylmuramoyl-tripeptide--D-alanyl-D-alanine ligase
MQCSPDPGENLAKAEDRIREAAGRGAQIICLQELFRSQYFCREENAELFSLAETIPGPSTERLSAVAKEKSSLVKVLPRDGLAFLNKDDPHVFPMSKLTDARVVTFGKSGADYSWDRLISTEPGKLAFALDYRDRSIILETRLTGAHNRLPVSAAAACALELGASESSVVDAIASFEPVFGRLSIHRIDGGPIFILDTYKAPYHSLQLALSVLRDCVAPRKRFVLGQISDYPGKPKPRYRDTYRAAAKIADQVIFVGEHAHRSKATEEEIESAKFVRMHSIEALSAYIKSTAVAGEVILLKSAGALHLERVMLDWKTTVRCWPDTCKTKFDCLTCGAYERPFAGRHRRGAGAIERALRRLSRPLAPEASSPGPTSDRPAVRRSPSPANDRAAS